MRPYAETGRSAGFPFRRIGHITILCIVGCLGIVFYGLTQPLAAAPVRFPFGIISRSQAEFMAQSSSGRLVFQGPTTTTSSLSTYHRVLQHRIRPDQPVSDTPNVLVWVVEVHGIATFHSPEPDAPATPPRPYTFTQIIGIFGSPHIEMSR